MRNAARLMRLASQLWTASVLPLIPTSSNDFKSLCAKAGKQAQCCSIPVTGQALLCQIPTPDGNNPGGNNPGGNNPGGNNPGGNNPGGNNPGGNNPGGNNPGGKSPSSENDPNSGSDKPCPSGIYSNPQCCAKDVLGVSALDCKAPLSHTNRGNFRSRCSSAGKEAMCCTSAVDGQAPDCINAPSDNNPGSNSSGGDNPRSNNLGDNSPSGSS